MAGGFRQIKLKNGVHKHMKAKEIFEGLHDAILTLDIERARGLAEEIVKTDIDVTDAINAGMLPAMEEIGSKFQSGALFLPELQLSGKVFQAVMDILLPKLMESGQKMKSKGRIVFGTVKGDIHNIGKDLTCTILKTAGFDVVDLGVDVPTLTFLAEAQKNEADIIGLSALMSTTIPMQREIIEALKSKGLREKFRVIVGGAPVSQKWADEIGADGYGEDAVQAVELSKELCASKER
jgi:corrinoid protein of di/trimethylamine methyltransferase